MLLIQIYEVQRYTLYSGIVSVPIIYKYIYLKHKHLFYYYCLVKIYRNYINGFVFFFYERS